MTDRESATRNWKLTIGVTVGLMVLRLLALSWRIRRSNTEDLDALRAQRRPFIYAFWHGQMLPLLWIHRNQGVPVVVSSHRDGEIVARVAERLGFRTVRGSTTRGAARALLGIVRELEAGYPVAVTPDGPRGPAHSFAPGALVAAQRVGVPIVAIGVSARRAWRLRSWDRFLIPKPFATIQVAYSRATPVRAASARDAETEAPAFAALIDHLIDVADRA